MCATTSATGKTGGAGDPHRPDRCRDFYTFLSHYNRKAGTPSFSYRFLEHVTEGVTYSYQITRLFHKGEWIGGFFSFHMGGSVGRHVGRLFAPF